MLRKFGILYFKFIDVMYKICEVGSILVALLTLIIMLGVMIMNPDLLLGVLGIFVFMCFCAWVSSLRDKYDLY